MSELDGMPLLSRAASGKFRYEFARKRNISVQTAKVRGIHELLKEHWQITRSEVELKKTENGIGNDAFTFEGNLPDSPNAKPLFLENWTQGNN